VLSLFCGPGQLQERLRLDRLSPIATFLKHRRRAGFMESNMFRQLLLTLPLLVLPSMALAEKGGGTDRDRVSQEVEAMMRDGRWERAIAEGRANRQAFEALRQAQDRLRQPATGYTASEVARRRVRN
jgi:hypothetical protein